MLYVSYGELLIICTCVSGSPRMQLHIMLVECSRRMSRWALWTCFTFYRHNHSPSGSWRTLRQQVARGCKVLQSLLCWSSVAIQVHKLFAEHLVGRAQTQCDESLLLAAGSRSWLFHFLEIRRQSETLEIYQWIRKVLADWLNWSRDFTKYMRKCMEWWVTCLTKMKAENSAWGVISMELVNKDRWYS